MRQNKINLSLKIKKGEVTNCYRKTNLPIGKPPIRNRSLSHKKVMINCYLNKMKAVLVFVSSYLLNVKINGELL